MDNAGRRLALDDDIACNFAARAEWFLRFAIEFGFDAPGVTERQDKLVLAFPSGLFTRSEQRLLGTTAIDLYDDPTQLCRLKIQRQLSIALPQTPRVKSPPAARRSPATKEVEPPGPA